ERLIATRARARALERALAAELARWDVAALEGPLPLVLDHAHVGAGYACPTAESLAACASLAGEGIALEPVYTGKAMAALLADARRLGLKSALLWCTVRRALPAPEPAFRERLPPALRRRLASAAADAPAARTTRRRVLVGLAAAAAAGLAVRLTGYA